ncbi:MAG: hypothetical protein KIS69_10355 [Bacteroidetes bacterium]|nr:hypothetical protein [Bacteroidota bacterium]
MGALVPYNPNTSINLGGGGGAIDLNALISGGGAFNISGIGNNNLTPAATTSTSNTNTSSSTSKAGSSNTRTTGVSNLNSNKIINKKLLDDKSLQILQDTIAALAGGQGNPLLSAIDKARGTGIVNTQNLITGQDPNEAVARAGGRVSELSRKMQEEAIATLLGSNEASGFGGNALSQLLAQDAAVRTGEAQSRVQEEAYNQAISNQLSGTNVLNQLLGGGSAVQNALMEALNIAKGSIEQGTERTNATTTSDELANTVSSEQSSTTGSEGKTASLVDPIEWAKLAAQLSIAGAQQQTGPSALEKALAIYQGGGGNLNALLSGDSYDVTAFGRLKQMLGV